MGRSENDAKSPADFDEDEFVVGNFVESYANLTLKTLSVMEFVRRNANDDAVFLKLDDDVMINVVAWMSLMETDVMHRGFACHLLSGSKPQRKATGKQFVSRDHYRGEIYPPFCVGPFYFFTAKVAQEISKVIRPDKTQYILPEDVYVTGKSNTNGYYGQAKMVIITRRGFYLAKSKFPLKSGHINRLDILSVDTLSGVYCSIDGNKFVNVVIYFYQEFWVNLPKCPK